MNRGVFIPDVTVEMIKKAPLEAIEVLLAEGEMYDAKDPTLDKSEAYRIVFEDLTSIDGLFTGRHDYKHGKEAFMYGISTVMENIAAHVSDECYEAFQKRFFDNMVKSEERANAKQSVENTLDALERSSE